VLTQVNISVPLLGASAWVPSPLVSIASLGLSKTAQPDDSVQLCGSNDNTVTVDSTLALAGFNGFAGPVNQQNAGATGAAIGAFQYFAVIRTGGTTNPLNFTLEGRA
jgi:hypothetical protein